LRETEKDPIGFSIPKPLNARLDALVERANEAGESTTRTELVAALLLDATDSGPSLSKLVRRYRSATADDAVIAGEDEARFLDPPPARPGPRSRKPA